MELSFHAYKMNPDPNPNPNRDNPNNLLETIILLGYNVRIGWGRTYIRPFSTPRKKFVPMLVEMFTLPFKEPWLIAQPETPGGIKAPYTRVMSFICSCTRGHLLRFYVANTFSQLICRVFMRQR